MVALTRSHVVGGGLALLVAGLVLAFWPHEEPPVEEAIRRKIGEMTHAAEQKDIGAVMEGVSERFKTDQGWDKQRVRGVLLAQVLRGQWLRLFTTDLEVTEVSPTRGDFTVKFIFGRSEAKELEQLGQDSVMSAWRVEGSFENEDGEWRMVRASHRRLEPSELF
jgi:hypothetical protein